MWPLGVLLISLALCADAAIGNVQEKAMKLHNGSNSEMVVHLSTKKNKKVWYVMPCSHYMILAQS